MRVVVRFLLALGGSFAAVDGANAQISLTTFGSAYTQNFDSLAASGTSSTVPAGWSFFETGTSANTTYAADAGGTGTSNTYSYGTGTNTDRAFGTLRSSSLTSRFGAQFTNNTGNTITALQISYTGELWRRGAADRADTLQFAYSVDPATTNLNSGTYINVTELDFNTIQGATTGALDGNSTANQVSVANTINSLSIANGSSFFIRWFDADAGGANDGMAVDNFSLTPVPEPATVLAVATGGLGLLRLRRRLV